MFEEFSNKISFLLFKKNFFKSVENKSNFNNFISKSVNFLLILPLDEIDFNNSFDVVKYLKIHKKNVYVFLPEHKVNTPNVNLCDGYIAFSENDIGKLGLPKKNFLNKLNEKEFDVLIDLERDGNLFFASVVSVIKAKFKIGFGKPELTNLYNLLIQNSKINSEISYRNLLNSLKMFN